MTHQKKDLSPNIATNKAKSFAIGAPDETIVKPAVILPITDAEAKNNTPPAGSSKQATTTTDDTDTNAAGDVIDSGNNYTAAENDHGTNATL